jgi:hypothetical protein
MENYREPAKVPPDPSPKREWGAIFGVGIFVSVVLAPVVYMFYLDATKLRAPEVPPAPPICDCRCKCEVDCPDPPPKRPD